MPVVEPDLRTIQSRDEWDDVAAGEAVLCGYPSSCSACQGLGEGKDYPPGQVVMAVITRRGNIGKPGFWHGWWSCTGPESAYHWDRGVIRQRLIDTGSATP